MKQKINNRLSILLICFVFSFSATANNRLINNESDTLNGKNTAETVTALQEEFSDLDSYFSNAPSATAALSIDLNALQNLKLTAVQKYEAKSGNKVQAFNISSLKFKQVGKNSFVEVEGYVVLNENNKDLVKSIKANSYWASEKDFDLNDLIQDALSETFYAL